MMKPELRLERVRRWTVPELERRRRLGKRRRCRYDSSSLAEYDDLSMTFCRLMMRCLPEVLTREANVLMVARPNSCKLNSVVANRSLHRVK